MSFDVTSAFKDDLLPSSSILNDPNKVVAKYILLSKNSGDACKDCPFNKEYYIALNEHGYWKAQHEKAKERIEEALRKRIKNLKQSNL